VTRRAWLIITTLLAAMIGLGTIAALWFVRSWLWHEYNRHAFAGTQCAIVASAVAERLRGHQEIDGELVAAVVADIARTEGDHYSTDPDADALLDPWGNPLSIKVKRVAGNYVIFVRSAGPDGIMGNGDDYLWDKTRWSARSPAPGPEQVGRGNKPDRSSATPDGGVSRCGRTATPTRWNNTCGMADTSIRRACAGATPTPTATWTTKAIRSSTTRMTPTSTCRLMRP